MDGKKDPGKFTVRFNTADPRQREVADILNRQGRFKAQFLTNAVQHYVHDDQTLGPHEVTPIDTEQIERIVRSILAEQRPPQAADIDDRPGPNAGRPLHGTERDAIFKTLEAFQQQ